MSDNPSGCIPSEGNFPPDGIILYAKQSGITSFTSLWAIKHALNTSKIGHTGTLDNFADGLLVVLSNRMTKFVSHVTDFDKTYEAIIRFGEETDTLDIDGKIIATSQLPDKTSFSNAVLKLTGPIDQIPPVYSAIQVKGHRASDLLRSGKKVELKPRKVKIYKNEIIEFNGLYAHIKVSCSKGTYIRALARDLAAECGSKAHLVALRRTSVGPFLLNEAAGFEKLPEFSIKNLPNLLQRKSSPSEIEEPTCAEIQSAVKMFTPELAVKFGLLTAVLNYSFYDVFLNGRPIKKSALENLPDVQNKDIVVFAFQDGAGRFLPFPRLCGVIQCIKNKIKYVFVIQDDLPQPKPVNHKKPIRKNK